MQASIEIIDADGLAAFSLPRLAEHLGVRAPSLYHHFADKNEILSEVARHITGASLVRPRRAPGPEWTEYFVDVASNFRRTVLRHRNAASLLLQYPPRDVLVGGYEIAARFLRDSGVPTRWHVRILDGMETLTVGAVLTEAAGGPRNRTTIFPEVDPRSRPALAEALAANDLSAKQLFEAKVRSFLRGVLVDAVGLDGTGETTENAREAPA